MAGDDFSSYGGGGDGGSDDMNETLERLRRNYCDALLREAPNSEEAHEKARSHMADAIFRIVETMWFPSSSDRIPIA